MMTTSPPARSPFSAMQPRPQELEQASIELVNRWLRASEDQASENQTSQDPATKKSRAKKTSAKKFGSKGSRSAELLAEVLKDPQGLDFTIGFVDRVVRPEDPLVAAHNLQYLAAHTPAFLPWYMKAGLRLGGVLAPKLPWLVVPVAQRVLRHMVGHLIVDARSKPLGRAIKKLRSTGDRLNLNLLGEAVLGDQEAARRLAGTKKLLSRKDVDYVSVKVSAVVAQLNLWAFEESVERIVTALLPLYQLAANSPDKKFINLDMEEYHDLDLTVAVFKRLLERSELRDFEAGIVLQAYLPDAVAALADLTEWSQRRQATGGAGIKVRLVKGANLAMERVDAAIHGWPLATVASKQEADTNYKRCLDFALRPENAAAVRIGVAGHNLFDIALAHLLAERRGVSAQVDFEMLLGMAEDQAAQVRKDVGQLLLYTPVVQPRQFDVAISYLIRRLEENASSENFMSAVFDLTRDPALLERETKRFQASLAAVDTQVPTPNRQQDPYRSSAPRISKGSEARTSDTKGFAAAEGFENIDDSDSSLPQIRSWAEKIFDRIPESALGLALVASSGVTSEKQVSELHQRGRKAARSWAARSGAERAAVLRDVGRFLAQNRAELIEVAASETGKVLAEADVEVSEAVDFAYYYAQGAEELDRVAGARFVPATLTVVTPPWNFPLAITTGSVLAPLASGSAVILKPAPQAKRCSAVIAELLWRAGVPRDALQYADVPEGPLGQRLISDPAVDKVILTGGFETARLFRSWRHDLPLLAETSGKNAMIITPSADMDLAARDVVKSAFGHAGQKCSAASLVILVGSVADSERFRSQLLDAAASLTVAWPHKAGAEMSPVIEPPQGKLRMALTELGADESWLLPPRSLDDSGRLFSPGIRDGVRSGSYFHVTEFFGPVLGVMTAETLEEAVELQNAPAYGLTAGLYTLDPEELSYWLDRVQAGNLYVNRGITGAIVRRQPFGGWKRSAIGPGAKAGGPNYLVHLGSWEPTALPEGRAQQRVAPELEQFFQAVIPELDADAQQKLRRSLGDDALCWEQEFSQAKDVSQLGVERNVFRYLPTPVQLRYDAAPLWELLRVVAAAWRSGAEVTISSAKQLPTAVSKALRGLGITPLAESEEEWLRRLAELGSARVRVIAAEPQRVEQALVSATAGDPELAVYAYPVLESGRVELLPFLHEQSVTITAHRFGNPDNISATVF